MADAAIRAEPPMADLPASVSVQLDPASFQALATLIYDRAGILLKEGKESLVQARLGRRMRDLNLSEVKAYLKHVADDDTGEELVLLLDAIATNTTSFFREPACFDHLTEWFTRWLKGGQRRFRFWSAASSSGEEVFTMAMVVDQVLTKERITGVDVAFLATDLSTKILDRCRQAVYSDRAVAPVPPALRKQYFEAVGDAWRVVEPLRRQVTFNRLNLAKPPFPMKGPFDLVFCRNVMIYFDNTVRSRLIGEIRRLLRDDGFLLVGAAESLAGIAEGYKTVRPAIYRKT